MAIKFVESFGMTTSTTEILQGRWQSQNDCSFGSSYGRTGDGLRLGTAGSCHLTRTLDNNYATYGVRFAFQVKATITFDQGIVEFRDSTTPHITLYIKADHRLEIKRGQSTVLATSTATLSQNVWYDIEMKATIDDSTGAVEVRVNGSSVPWITVSSADTRNGANAYTNSIRLGHGGGGEKETWVDDYIEWDTSGSAPTNTFLGRAACYVLRPDGVGATTQFTPSAGANYTTVDETTPDDTDYVESSTVGNKDTYTIGNLSGTGTILGVAVSYRAKATDAGAIQGRGVVRHSTLESYGATAAPATSYTYRQDVFELNPSTGVAWTVTEVNAAEIGQQVQ
jgi:hypothetical protein